MSIPKLGITDEAIGVFECDILEPNLDDDQYLIFKVDMSSLVIDNKYYQSLYDNSVIDLILSIDCFNVYKELKTSVKNQPYIEYPKKDAGGKFVASIFFVAIKDFILNTKNSSFSSFYNEEYKISKGQIVSKVIKKHIDIDLTSSSSSFKFLSVIKNPDLESEFKIKLDDESPELSIKSEDVFFDYDNMRKSKKLKGIDKLSDAILLGPLFVELIRIIIEGRLNGENFEWAEVIAKKMGHNTLDELTEKYQGNEIDPNDSFQIAYNLYSSKMYSQDYFKDLFNILKNI